MSWEEMRACLDQEAELASRRAIFVLQAQRKIQRVLMEQKNCSLLPLIRSAVLEGFGEALLDTLDQGREAGLGCPQIPPFADLYLRPSMFLCQATLGSWRGHHLVGGRVFFSPSARVVI